MSDRACSRILGQLAHSPRVLIVMHATPDGDSAGSGLALGLALQELGHSVTWVAWDAVPARLAFLPGYTQVQTWAQAGGQPYDCAIAVDCGSPSRLAAPQEFWSRDLPLINIDHHRGNPDFGTINWVEPEASSTGELVTRLFQYAHWPVSADIALCLFTAISTDTLSFRQINASVDTLAAVEWLVRHSNLNMGRANHLIWDSRSVGELKFLGWVLDLAKFSEDQRFAWVGVTRRAMSRFGVDDSGVDTVVHHLLSIAGVEVAFLAKETAQSGQVKVSWRAKPPWDASQLAAQFGGGGHAYAAAAQLEASLSKSIMLVRTALGSWTSA
ncbi:MAG: bifunctional oligoribonuclease/PAP phosphatase NrnA [Sulfobacillus acidophilus]|uniref:Bifunctional oligoribonuclease/PAP phosphatase NrnA n=1 Tax=Sulfobacillus acidophilus TaxID=53633 RepID=A0A2T2WNI1_9FIRM|nr:MAG: bifunctional oligoribonuclease/PAP phosphatase NrnA [Sulfobacillus acidophilus]